MCTMPSSDFATASNSAAPAFNPPDWKEALERDGYVVIKNVISQERAAHYVDEMNSWVEGFGLGYNRHDPSTWVEDNLPVMMKCVDHSPLSLYLCPRHFALTPTPGEACTMTMPLRTKSSYGMPERKLFVQILPARKKTKRKS